MTEPTEDYITSSEPTKEMSEAVDVLAKRMIEVANSFIAFWNAQAGHDDEKELNGILFNAALACAASMLARIGSSMGDPEWFALNEELILKALRTNYSILYRQSDADAGDVESKELS